MAEIPTTSKSRWMVLFPILAIVFAGLVITISGDEFMNALAKPKSAITLPAEDDSSGDAGIRTLIAKYAKSIDEADTSLASQVWSNSIEVSFIHPLGHEHNLKQIKQNIYRHLMGGTFSERKLIPRDISIHVYGNSAWAEFYWDFTAKLRKDGTFITTHGRETQVYRKEQGAWRLVHVHYSGMPASVQQKGF
jgi:ketosteroid isomerase-like protein